MLNKNQLTNTLFEKISKLLVERSNGSSGDESQDPQEVITNFAKDLSVIISDAVEDYVKSGDIYITNSELSVISAAPGSACAVTTIQPIKLK